MKENYFFTTIDFAAKGPELTPEQIKEKADHAEMMKNPWLSWLGFEPDGKAKPRTAEHKCYNCGATDIKSLPAGSWTSIGQCNSCGYYNYTVHADFSGGALNEDVAWDEKLSKKFSNEN